MNCLQRPVQYYFLLCTTCVFWNSAQISPGDIRTNQDPSYFFYQRPEYPRDCKEALNECSSSSSSGVYLIKPDGYSKPFEVFCNHDLDFGGWTVVERRIDGSVSFDREWEEYKNGFGFPSTEFWLGNEKLSYITNQDVYELQIDMVLSNGSSFYVNYDNFRITDEWGHFSLYSVGDFSGNDSSVVTYCPPNTVFQNSTCEPVQNTQIYTDCHHAYQTGRRDDGVYTIRPTGWTKEPFSVSCNMSIDGGGWTVLQRRVNGSVRFEQNWEEYKNGFGILDHEFWLGNDKIHSITNQKNYELRMDMVNLDEDAYYAKYSLFGINDETSKYQLELGVYDSASTASYDAMDYHRGQFFSTPDRDNDATDTYHCANNLRAGWWYNTCSRCDFNQPNIGSCSGTYPSWSNLPGSDCLLYTDIKIRPV